MDTVLDNNLLFTSEDESDHESYRARRNFKERVNYNFENETQFKESFRISTPTFELLLEQIGEHLEHPTKRNHALSPSQQLMTALHWLGNGGQYHGVASMHGISKHTVQRSMQKVTTIIKEHLFKRIVRWPDEHILDVPLKFSRLANFPRVAGCVDGTLIQMDAPQDNEAAYVDRNGSHSINAMVVSGPDLQFYYASARWPGSVSDQRVLRNSTLQADFEQGWRPFPNAVLLGDSIYALRPWLITPIVNGPLTEARIRFLQSHKSTRRVVECALGVLKEKFPCLNYLRVQPIPACQIILACITLHNLEKKYQEEVGNHYNLNDVNFEIDENEFENDIQLPEEHNDVLNQLISTFE